MARREAVRGGRSEESAHFYRCDMRKPCENMRLSILSWPTMRQKRHCGIDERRSVNDEGIAGTSPAANGERLPRALRLSLTRP